MSDPLIGQHLGPFEILEAIGQGGMATVYKARQPAMNRVVAVKVLTTQMANNPTFVARFKQEAQLIASLEHAYILPVYDMGEQDGVVYIAMRYLTHGTLASRLTQGTPTLKEVSKWLEQIASALDYAHQRGVIHRDVKPSNVLLDAQGNVFLADFGIAKWYEASINLTGSGAIGTPRYMSPEQGQGLKVDGRSDEYALAVMAYEMIVGRPPFEAETPLAIVLKHVTEPLTPPNLVDPRIPQVISNVISKALSKNPVERYTTTGDFAQALSAAIAAEPIGETQPLRAAEPTAAALPVQPRPAQSRRRQRLLGLGLLVAMLIAVSLGGWLWLRGRVSPQPARPEATIELGPNVRLENSTPIVTPPTTAAPVISVTTTAQSDACVPPLFAETFDDQTSGLPRGEQDDTQWGYVAGAYQLLIKVANKAQTRLLGPALTDYDVTVEAHFASGNLGSYGLAAAARGPADYYALLVDGEQRYAITRRTPTGTRTLQEWQFSSALQPGQATNHLRVTQRGDELSFYANDTLLRVLTDDGDPQARRSIGLTAASFGTGTDARFDNLRVCPPAARAPRRISLVDAFDDNRNGWAPQQFSASGGSSLENGRFVIEAVYPGYPYSIFNWNPSLAFDEFDLKIDAQLITGTPSSRVGVLFGAQDLNNFYWFDLTNEGRYHLYRRQAGEVRLLSEGFSPLIHPDLVLNHLQLTMISNTLAARINDRAVVQAAIDYTPGYVGLWCGVYQPDRTSCAFDNLQVSGTPSSGQLLLYPFCNCRRVAYVDQPLIVKWQWGSKSIEYLDQFKAGTTLTVTVDGQPIEQPQHYWTAPQVVDNEAEMFWSYNLPALTPGSHLIEYVVASTKKLTDGLDENGDGQLDTFGPGDIYRGYVEVVVQP